MSDLKPPAPTESKAPKKFLAIFGRDPEKIRAKEQKKADTKSYEIAFAALKPWCKKTKAKSVGELGWLASEQTYFADEIDRARVEKKDDNFAGGAVILQGAKTYAEARDSAKILRQTVTTQIETARQILAKIPGTNTKAADLARQLTQAAEDLRISETPKDIASRVQVITKDANNLLGGDEPAPSELEKERMRLRVALLKVINDKDAALRRQAVDTLHPLNGKDAEVTRADLEASRLFNEEMTKKNKKWPVDVLLEDDPKETDPKKLLTALQGRFEEQKNLVEAAATAVANRIGKDSGKDLFGELVQTQKSRAKDVNTAEAREKFLADFKEVESAMATLRDMGPRGAAELDKMVASDKELILKTNAYDLGPASIKELLGKIESAIKTAETSAAGPAAALENDIAVLKKELKGQKTKPNKRVWPAYDKLIGELEQLDVIVATNNVNAFGAARQRMAEIRQAGVTGAPKILPRINSAADAIALVTANKTVIKEFSSETNEIKLAVETTLKELDLFAATTAAKTFGTLRTQATNLQRKTDSLVTWREKIKDRITNTEGMVKEFRKLQPNEPQTTFELNLAKAKEKYKAVGVDRAEVDKLIAAAARVYSLTVNLQSVRDLPNNDPKKIAVIEKLRNDLDSAKKILEVEYQKKSETENATKTLKAGIRKYNEDLKVAATNVKNAPHGDTEELKELEILGEQMAKKMKAGDEEGARKQLASIRKRLDALITSPGGVTAESVRQLESVDSLWTAALGKMRTQLDAIHEKAAVAAPAARLDPNDIKRRIDEVYARFEPFEKPLVQAIRVLADEKADLKRRKAERENALRDVRSIRTILTGNPLIGRLANNPFGIASPFKEMTRFVASMEYNALRAVPPE